MTFLVMVKRTTINLSLCKFLFIICSVLNQRAHNRVQSANIQRSKRQLAIESWIHNTKRHLTTSSQHSQQFSVTNHDVHNIFSSVITRFD